MKKIPLSRLTALLPILPLAAAGADLQKVQNTTALNAAGSFTVISGTDADTIPDADDTIIWNNAYTTPGLATTLSTLGGDLSVLGIKVTNVGGAANAATTMVGFQNASSANTLTIGSGGIDMSAATQSLTLQSKILLGANQTWNLTNANTATNPQGFNNGEDLAFNAQVLGASFNLGGNTVNTTGTGQLTITSGYTVSNGTINIGNNLFLLGGGSSRLTTVNNDVTFNVATGSTLHFQSNSAGTTSAANIGLNGGTLKLASAAATLVTLTGTTTVNSPSTLLIGNNVAGGSTLAASINYNANLAGSAALAITHTATTATPLFMGGNNSAYSGTLSFTGTAGRVARLTTANSGSAAATWNVGTGFILQADGVAVNLGTLAGAGSITNSHATNAAGITVGGGTFSGTIVNGTQPISLTKNTGGTLTLTGANTYTGATAVNAGTLITSPLQTGATNITVADGATFGVRLAGAGTTFNTPSLAVGTATGGTVLLDAATFGNPSAPMINAAAFNPVAGTVLKVTSNPANPLTAGTFTLVDYTTLGGGGFAGLQPNLSLPLRVVGSLVDNTGNTSIDLNIQGVETPKWMGNLSANWDADDGTPTGTQNWKTAFTGMTTRYLQNAPAGTDSVIFDDTASGPNTNVNLTTTLTPAAVAVNNSATPYTFSGSGKLSGAGGITKSGGGTLTVVNTTNNDYSGATQINAGTVQVGDGVTAGAGSLGTGPVVNNGTLNINRPDGTTIAGPLSGTGSLVLNKALTSTGGGTFNGVVSGGATLTAGGGTLQLAGGSPNTNGALTTVSAGLLQLNKTAGVNAVGGDVLISGGGQLAILAGEQIPDSATITFTGTSADSIPTQSALETVANVVCSSSVAAGQLIMRSGFTVTGTASVTNGILGVASTASATVNAINMTGGSVRIAGNGGPSTLNVGAGGITASTGVIEVKFNTANQDAILNLGGNFKATGNVAINNGGYTGVNLNVINLTATRSFDIATGTVTTVQPDIAGPGGLTKDGGGTLALTTLVNGTYAGITTINAGTLSLAGAASLSLSPSIVVKSGATFDVSASSPAFTLAAGQTIGGKGTVVGAVAMAPSAILSPGESAGTLTFNGNLDISAAVGGAGSSLSWELDTPGASDLALLGAGGILSIGSGVLEFSDFGFTPLGGFGPGTYTLFNTQNPINETLGAGLTGTVNGLPATLGFGDGTNDLVLSVVPEPGSAALALTGLALLGRRRRR